MGHELCVTVALIGGLLVGALTGAALALRWKFGAMTTHLSGATRTAPPDTPTTDSCIAHGPDAWCERCSADLRRDLKAARRRSERWKF